MKQTCINLTCAAPDFVIKDGFFRRKDDSKWIQRYRCKSCGFRFSSATMTETYRQKKRRINATLLRLFASGMTQNRAAVLVGVTRLTVARKFAFIGARCRGRNEAALKKLEGKVHNIQIDDLITKENSKLKPLAVSVAVDENRRKILGLEVSQIPAFGHLAQISVKKYGKRKDEHFEGLTRLFQNISKFAASEVLIKSDEHATYPAFVSAYFPRAKHQQFKSERACVAGQGELKKVKYDPLFVVNHTCAMLRANISRLVRKTWTTTKSVKRLEDHLQIFMYYYNEVLLKKTLTPI